MDFLFCAGAIVVRFAGMPTPPPNGALIDLAAVIGEDNVRTLVRTFLREFPISLQNLGQGERSDRHRIAHSMKSSSRLMGAHDLSQRLAALEGRLAAAAGGDVTKEDLAAIAVEFEALADPMSAFVID